MEFIDRTERWQRHLLGAVLAGSALLFWRGSLDVFNTLKATWIMLGGLAIVAVSAVRVARTRRIQVSRTMAWVPLGGFVIALLVATVASDATMYSIVGRPGRHTGLVMYLVYAFLLLSAARLYWKRPPDDLARWIVAAAVPAVLYGLLQAVGEDPLGWRLLEGGPPVFATLGNANFFAAYLGITVPLALALALCARTPVPWRTVAFLYLPMAVTVAVLSRSLQGPAAALSGGLLVLCVWPFSSVGVVRRLRWPIAAGVFVATAAVAGAAVAGAGPLAGARAMAARSLETRIPKWETAIAMFGDRPLTGFGLDAFVDWFHQYRDPSVAAETGLARTTDTPHMVPLDMMVSGGILLGVTYLGLVAVTGWALWRGLRGTDGDDRLLVAGVGGAWLAYQVQSLVSIDVPPLAAMHWVLAGVLIGIGATEGLRTTLLPGAPMTSEFRPGDGRRAAPPRLRRLNPLVAALGVGLLLAMAWVAVTPLRADIAAGRAMEAVRQERVDDARRHFAQAARTGFWEARYPLLHAELLVRLGELPDALARHEEAAAREPRGLAHAINIGRTSAAIGDHARASEAYVRAVELDPHTPEVLVEVGRYRLERDDPGRARALLERAIRLRGDQPGWWVVLGEARLAEGDEAGARQAFEQALDLDPEVDGATEGLDTLAERSAHTVSDRLTLS